MATPPRSSELLNKVVVAYVDGRRVKGFVYDFSPQKDAFSVFPEDDPLGNRGAEVHTSALKAVFFVRDFAGNPAYHEAHEIDPTRHGRRLEVTFQDGEKISGTTEAYNPQKLGFFMSPADPNSNNTRIFVINRSVSKVRWLPAAAH